LILHNDFVELEPIVGDLLYQLQRRNRRVLWCCKELFEFYDTNFREVRGDAVRQEKVLWKKINAARADLVAGFAELLHHDVTAKVRDLVDAIAADGDVVEVSKLGKKGNEQMRLKIFDSEGDERAFVFSYEDAAAFASFLGDGATVRYRGAIVWTEGKNGDGFAGESYDAAAETMIARVKGGV